MRKRVGAWTLCLLCLLVLSFSGTAYSGIANSALIGVRVLILIALSILVLRERWRLRDGAHPNADGSLLRGWRRWFYGEE